MRLYELTKDYMDLLYAIDNEEIPEEAITDTLEAITASIEEKADNIACMLKGLEAEAQAIKEEESCLAERRKAKERAYERIKAYLSEELLKANITAVDTARNKITFRKSESVHIANEDDFVTWAMVKDRCDLLKFGKVTPDKTAIKKAINDGATIEGAELRVNQNIQLR
jgi:hypothetical protein